ncbi:MAG: SprT family zinc-dependent metalloprotease [Neisseria sp.]|uniref:M48 family metallopeptidase n=1 Tax=Neisseria sp. TaxID=192066 RepID=UPI0026DCA8B5|nr:SprT family zinc-dependent metalloprotease [Neisseria sp.]MDO4640104.1 SprT family zinc-dependent metalloprotease [Neisseria sp.]
MVQKTHTLQNGRRIALQLKRSAKKNIIMRPVSADAISVNIPPFLSESRLMAWLLQNEHHVLDLLSREMPAAREGLPAYVWYRGERYGLGEHDEAFIGLSEKRFLLPRGNPAAQKGHFSRYLKARAEEVLLPRLRCHAESTGFQPAATALSDAKTFWGVCRARTGIRLNWRLIGAPDFVLDYVCIHELCHLRQANHSPKFWALVDGLTPHTAAAKAWLKRHGNELFILG